MAVVYNEARSYKVPVNRRIYDLDVVVLGNDQVALRLDGGTLLKPVFRSPSNNGVERFIDLKEFSLTEIAELVDTPQQDGRVPVSVRDLRERDAARILQDFIMIKTGQTIKLDNILRRYCAQISQLYGRLSSDKP